MAETTYIEEADVYQCNNCGACAQRGSVIEHYSSCKSGEAKWWEDFYNKANEED